MHDGGKRIESEFIPLPAESADDAVRHRRNIAVVAKRLALVDVRQMHFDDWQAASLQRVVHCHRRVRITSRVYDYAGGLFARLLYPADQFALDIGLSHID